MAQWTTNYSDLLELIGTYIEDTSTEFVAAAPGVINRAEDRLLRDLDLSIWNVNVTTTTATGSATLTKSVDLVQSIYDATNSRFLDRRTYDFVAMYGGSGPPLYYSEADTAITLAPTPDNVYSIRVRHLDRPQALSASNTTNWFTDNAADALLAASLVESERFLIAPERVTEFEQDYAAKIGPLRAFWRDVRAEPFEPLAPAPTVERTR
jgi:hypothetical protein